MTLPRTQVELERETREAGRARAVDMMDRRERDGHADTNPYAAAVYRRWLLPLADVIEAEVQSTGKAGRRAAHVALLKPLDPRAVAHIAVRAALVSLLKDGDGDVRRVARAMGRDIYGELVLSAFAHVQPEIYWTLLHNLAKRRSTAANHRVNVIRNAANSHEVELPQWLPTDREQVSLWLIEQLRLLGMVDVRKRTTTAMGGKYVTEMDISMTDAAKAVVGGIRQAVEYTMPYALPFIEQPKDWVSMFDGGYHTQEMRRQLPGFVNFGKTSLTLDEMAELDMPNVREAINHLQAVRWRVNKRVLSAMKDCARHGIDMDEIISQAEKPKPTPPEWLTPEMKKEDMTGDELVEFSQWKRRVAEWHTERKLNGTKWGRFYMTTRMADKFRDYPVIYFLYQADFRGRLYAQTTGISPQGSDMQKALLEFAEGKRLDTPEAVRWFKIAGANRFGVDKVPFEDRIAWVHKNEQYILQFAADPVSHHGWREADSPLQFLAWCFEYVDWRAAPATFESRVAVGLDGSCNGLQHFSAMLRDSVGGRAVNLVPSDRPNDIYQRVADVVALKLSDPNLTLRHERDSIFKEKWKAHGMNRSIVKRSVMTLPYGSTRFSCAEFIVEDYLSKGKAVQFETTEYRLAAEFLSHLVWEAISEVVIAAAAAMSWLQRAAGLLLKRGGQQIGWTAPSGFKVQQAYFEIEVVRVNSKLLGHTMIKVANGESNVPSARRHKNGIAPNFVHSMDAAHLTLTVQDCKRNGVNSMAMIHDDYGTHAADTEKLYRAVRKTFVEMYETHDPLVDFRDQFEDLPALPSRGDLSLAQVQESPFFFA
ncbi:MULTISPECIES: DNA-directed RNA polymerase [Burkholderia]|uniref:DNA-directed RNA polymerase n=1 Tax=Burkholderia TaxID=32008 RepID=UPI000751B890|nr:MULTISPECIES: DNA-directed RNA polymerase [Burkholderia]AOJ69182.1 DNA-directed RNA polymerase [Burkholderia savannae]KVG39821.1 DNA-directed RNA polymerase [Burkholderia sp. MSMB0265]KVG85768.1 DNA-directed RNA polymerase [Burkholderia sp. MSMB2040]KVG92217.1 DNA-directed RNA polymerase [Burkholderia sp. MSMB2041]KVG95705.1 DNA-directed RNA polymerase [Burkholderia sp. MSMB2042]